MKSFVLFAILLGLIGCRSVSEMRTRTDDIQALVIRLSASHVWRNGGCPILELPASASFERLVERVFELTSFSAGAARAVHILESRRVQIPGPLPDEYIAIRVSSDMGPMIVLLKYEVDRLGWWSRVYQTEPNQ